MNKRINTVVTLSFKKKPVAALFHLTFRYFKQMLLTYSEARQYKKKRNETERGLGETSWLKKGSFSLKKKQQPTPFFQQYEIQLFMVLPILQKTSFLGHYQKF